MKPTRKVCSPYMRGIRAGIYKRAPLKTQIREIGRNFRRRTALSISAARNASHPD
jgi:hypothetical protein